MKEHPAPKPAALVRQHLAEILRYIAEVDADEARRLQTASYSLEQFRLSYPFFKSVEQIEADGQTARYWIKDYRIADQRVRVCSQWRPRNQPFFLNYLVEHGIPITGVSPELREHWINLIEQAGTRSRSPWGARYRTYSIGVAQNDLVRFLLSNLGAESFTRLDWQAVKETFGNACAYCGQPGAVEMDHAIPLSRSELGEHRMGNIVPACRACNGAKHDRSFRVFLAERHQSSPHEAASRIAAIEAHMARYGYHPLGDRPIVRELIDQARQEIAEVGANYCNLINGALEQAEIEQDSGATAKPGLPRGPSMPHPA